MPTRLSAKELEIEHEAFKNRLVHDVLGRETGDKVPMEKVVMLIWTFREDPEVVTFVSRFVAKYAGVRHVFDGIEFYLPQLAHMIIHLEVDWDDEILERFALIIAQQSLHFALQLNWILQGALQDYAPEDAVEGNPNPKYNRVFYLRCQKLLKNVERCVVYGKPRAQELQRLYEKGKITKQEMVLLEQADRRFNALQITAMNDDEDALNKEQLDGWLFIHLPWKNENEESSSLASLEFRYCVLERNILNVYKTKNTCNDQLLLDRAMMLENSTVAEAPKHGIRVTTPKYTFKILCGSKEDQTLWMRRLGEEAKPSALFAKIKSEQLELSSRTADSAAAVAEAKGENAPKSTGTLTKMLKQDMTPAQLNRYEFFENERNFIADIVGVAESLRLVDRPKRKEVAPGRVKDLRIPPNVYLPLCNSSDIWRRVCATVHKQTRVFNTKERCPTVIHFVVKRGETITRATASRQQKFDPTVDVAEYMHNYFDLVSEQESGGGGGGTAKIKEEGEGSDDDEEEDFKDASQGGGGAAAAVGAGTDSEKNGGRKNPMESTSEHGSMRSNVWEEGEGIETTNDPAAAGAGAAGATSNDSNIKTVSSSSPSKKEKDSKEKDPKMPRGNKQVQRLMKESVVTLPNILANRMGNRSSRPGMRGQKRVSIMDLQTEMQPMVPILEGKEYRASVNGIKEGVIGGGVDDDELSVVSVEASSMMVKDQIVLGNLDEGDIDLDCINRATQFISGGESWAQKSANMLAEAMKEDQDNGAAAAAAAAGTNTASGRTTAAQMEIVSCVAKSYDDLRQEVFVMQMIHYYKSVFAQAKLPLYLKTYRILSTDSCTGLLELLTDSTSLDGLKKSPGYPTEGGLRKYFELVYGKPDTKAFKAAQTNFLQSLAAYAIVSYLLGLKDRHNGNIMIDTRGHLIFIDFGFAFGMAPGNAFSFERAPFKMTKEYVELMDGVGSPCYKEFERLFVAGFEEARKNSQIALGLVEIMMFSSNYPCFSGSRHGDGKALIGFEKRLMLRTSDHKVKQKALKLIRKSRQHTGTYLYDVFQKATNGYAI